MRRAVGVSTWFRVPQYMDEHEILCRGSAFFVGGLAVASAHVLEPWRFPRYFPEAFIRHVEPAHCRYFLEARAPDATVAAAVEAAVAGAHATRDAAALAPLGDAAALGAAPLALRSEPPGGALSFAGHAIEDRGGAGGADGGGDDDRVLVPRTVGGAFAATFNAATEDAQHFATTDAPLGMGMCGGPVLSARGGCVGMVEGIVPPGAPRFAGHACFVGAAQLEEMLAAAAAPPRAPTTPPPPPPPGLARDFTR